MKGHQRSSTLSSHCIRTISISFADKLRLVICNLLFIAPPHHILSLSASLPFFFFLLFSSVCPDHPHTAFLHVVEAIRRSYHQSLSVFGRERLIHRPHISFRPICHRIASHC